MQLHAICSHFPTANTVSFNQSVYNVNEENEVIQIVLVLSSSLPNDTAVQVISNNINATGMYVNEHLYLVMAAMNVSQRMIISLDLTMLLY